MAGHSTGAGRDLVHARAVGPAYVDEMVQLIDDGGPWCVVAPGIALPHARPSALVRRPAAAIVTLLEQLADTPDERRAAQFRCAVAACHPDGRELVVEGVMAGRVIREVRGEGGFGYDGLFLPDDQDDALSSAELAPEAKDAISHRGRALREIAPQVGRLLQG